jgi:hypothetical protein
MFDTYQGSIGSISPAFGGYSVDFYINIDRDPGITGTAGYTGPDSYTGPGAAGVTGTGSLELWKVATGLNHGATGTFTNNRSDEEIYF